MRWQNECFEVCKVYKVWLSDYVNDNNNHKFYMTPKLYIIIFSALYWNYYPVHGRVTQVLIDISAHYPWAMGVLLGDIHLSELERLNNLAPQRGLNCRPSDLKFKTLRTQPFCHQYIWRKVIFNSHAIRWSRNLVQYAYINFPLNELLMKNKPWYINLRSVIQLLYYLFILYSVSLSE